MSWNKGKKATKMQAIESKTDIIVNKNKEAMTITSMDEWNKSEK